MSKIRCRVYLFLNVFPSENEIYKGMPSLLLEARTASQQAISKLNFANPPTDTRLYRNIYQENKRLEHIKMPSFMSRTALAVACLIVTAQAFPSTLAEDPQAPVDEHGLPTVTPVFGGSDCESFGAGNFSLIISHCTNSTTNEPCDIEGFRNNVVPPPEGSGDGLASEGSVCSRPYQVLLHTMSFL